MELEIIDRSKREEENLLEILSKLEKDKTASRKIERAIKYALNNEIALKRFLTDGKIEIDNNAAERALRAIALGRKNWLFAGSDNGGNATANIYSYRNCQNEWVKSLGIFEKNIV